MSIHDSIFPIWQNTTPAPATIHEPFKGRLLDGTASAISVQEVHALTTVLVIPSLKDGSIVYSTTTLTPIPPTTLVTSVNSFSISSTSEIPTSDQGISPSTVPSTPLSGEAVTSSTHVESTVLNTASPTIASTHTAMTAGIISISTIDPSADIITIHSNSIVEPSTTGITTTVKLTSTSVSPASYAGVHTSFISTNDATKSTTPPTSSVALTTLNTSNSLSPSQKAGLGIGISLALLLTAIALFILYRKLQSKRQRRRRLDSFSDTSTMTNGRLSIAPVYDKAVYYPRRNSKLHGESGHSRETMVDANGVIWPERVELRGEAKELSEWTQACLRDYRMRMSLRDGGNGFGYIGTDMERGEDNVRTSGDGSGNMGVKRETGQDTGWSVVDTGGGEGGTEKGRQKGRDQHRRGGCSW